MKDMKETLERIVPEPEREADWDAVLRDARPSGARAAAPRLAILGAVLAFAALLAVAPWRGGEQSGILDRALAAVGNGPVFHGVLRFDRGVTRVDLGTGKSEPVYGETEFWYDRDRGLLHHIRRFGGVVEYEWVSRQKKPLDESSVLTILSREYPEALEAGTARVVKQDVVDGIPVYWIKALPDRFAFAWQVAISRETFKPVAVRETLGGKPGNIDRVLRLETMEADEADLDEADVTRSPTTSPCPSLCKPLAASVDKRIPLRKAAKALGRRPFWLGREHAGLPVAAYEYRISIRGAAGQYDKQTSGLSLVYEQPVDDPKELPEKRPSIRIAETTDPSHLPWQVPLQGSLRDVVVIVERSAFDEVSPPFVTYRGFLVRDGVYVSIGAVAYGAKSVVDQKFVVEAARALRPMPSAGSGGGG
jgi:hypothetical protein